MLEKIERHFLKLLINTVKNNGCWEWPGHINHSGYGEIRASGKLMKVHRITFEMFKYKIPPEFCIDHICRNRKCINPDHLRCVTRAVNCMENTLSPIAREAKKTHCKNGHELTGNNIMPNKTGRRRCRQCKAMLDKAYHQRKKSGKV